MTEGGEVTPVPGVFMPAKPVAPGNIVFEVNDGDEVMRIEPDGRFFVKGVEVESNQEIRDTFLSWVKVALDAGHI